MLHIKKISKQYKTGNLVQQALDEIDLTLRDNEFAAILGPSGSGKTTLLNIIGGLDRYDSGDLVINGISTRKFTDRDWDGYRNHTIGFVFQSYNLIPHQSLLANVELALTISGISGQERKKRAMEALEKVGLADQAHKKPSQLSGGQMQRVAIARALVNDPDILLADEPTGALDTKTSLMVMELLKEVAKDRLVVMVTHNPDLASQYATRIINLQDGRIISDSNPVKMIEHKDEKPATDKKIGKASMNFLTSLSLSFHNLWTKKTRTLLTAFAGSIGIIGIAAILSLSTGVSNYIQTIEEETLSEYPIEIQKTALNLDLEAAHGHPSSPQKEEDGSSVKVANTISGIFSSTRTNDLASLKTFLESDASQIDKYAKAIEYSYDIDPQIFLETPDGYRQVNPDSVTSTLGIGGTDTLLGSLISSDVFFQMPEESTLYDSQYEVVAGHWPEKWNECILVLSSSGSISDYLLYTMGLRDPDQLDEALDEFTSTGSATLEKTADSITWEDILKVEFKLVYNADLYSYDSAHKIWIDKSEDESYVKNLVKDGQTLKIVGVVAPTEKANGAALSAGINYPFELIQHIADYDASTAIVKDQLKHPDINVLTGREFGKESEDSLDLTSLFSINTSALNSLFALDASALAGNLDLTGIMDSLELDMTDLIDLSALHASQSQLEDITRLLAQSLQDSISQQQLEEIFTRLIEDFQQQTGTDISSLTDGFAQYLQSNAAAEILQSALDEVLAGQQIPTITSNDLQTLISEIMTGFLQYAQTQGVSDPADLPALLPAYLASSEAQTILNSWISQHVRTDIDLSMTSEQLQALAQKLAADYEQYAAENGLLTPNSLAQAFSTYLSDGSAQKVLAESAQEVLDLEKIQNDLAGYTNMYSNALAQTVSSQAGKLTAQIQTMLQQTMRQAFSGFGSQIGSLLNLQSDSLSDLFSFDMDMETLQELMLAMQTNSKPSLENNLQAFGYASFSDPAEISIYPFSFESKEAIADILSEYNARMEEEGQSDKVISYTDIVGTLMSSVTDIIDTISYVLIAFVSIALVVSSIMIGVITYISVLERQKEIGILRAMGASKRNISQVFNAETMIIGLTAGLIGIGVTLLLLIPGNILIHSLAQTDAVNAALPVSGAVILILLSIFLTVLGGLIPASKASKSDPVKALRSE